MTLLDKYLAKAVISALLLVLLLLSALEIFMMFVEHMGQVGRGDYTVWQALWLIVLLTPYKIYLFFPVAMLLACLIGLGALANHSELIIMRAAGLSVAQISWRVVRTLFILIILMSVIGETMIPQWVSYAENRKTMLKSGGKALRTQQGVWVRDQYSFIHIGAILPNRNLRDMTEYAFDEGYQLRKIRYAAKAEYQAGAWQLQQVRETVLHPDHIDANHYPSKPWASLLSPKFLAVTQVLPDEMNLLQLRKLIKQQQRNHLQAGNFELVFWQRILQPLTAIVMILIAIPFIFGPLRRAQQGARFLVGALVGFGFHMLTKFFGPVSLVYQLPPFWAACAPILLCAIIAGVVQRRC